MVLSGVSGYQMRSTAANAESCCCVLERSNDLRMICQTQIVVTAKCDVIFAVDNDIRCLRRFKQSTLAIQICSTTFGKRGGECLIERNFHWWIRYKPDVMQ